MKSDSKPARATPSVEEIRSHLILFCAAKSLSTPSDWRSFYVSGRCDTRRRAGRINNAQVRVHALREGERRLNKGTMGSSYLMFYRFGIEASLLSAAWDEMARYAQALEDFARPET